MNELTREDQEIMMSRWAFSPKFEAYYWAAKHDEHIYRGHEWRTETAGITEWRIPLYKID